MTRASLGVLPSTPVAFLQAEGGSLPARVRLEERRAAFATRLASTSGGPHAAMIRGRTDLRGGFGERAEMMGNET